MEELSVEPVQDSGEFEDGFAWESDVQPYEELNKELEESDYNMLKIKVKVSWSNRAHKPISGFSGKKPVLPFLNLFWH
jgi:hypothetical protein